MATKSLKVVRPGKYGTRMLKAGDTFEATGPEARLYSKLGWMEEARARAKAEAPKAEEAAEVATEEAPKAKRAPRKRKAAAKK
jgi:hypothetical protein